MDTIEEQAAELLNTHDKLMQGKRDLEIAESRIAEADKKMQELSTTLRASVRNSRRQLVTFGNRVVEITSESVDIVTAKDGRAKRP